MRISIDHRLSVTPGQGVSQMVFHLLLTPPSGPTQTVESWSVEMPGIGNAGRFTDGFGNTAHLVNQSRPEGEIAIRVKGTVTTRDTNGVLGRPGGEPVPALYRRLTTLTKKAPDFVERFREGQTSRLDTLHGLMAAVGESLGMPPETSEQSQMQADGGSTQSQSAAAGTRPAASDYVHCFIAAARALDIPTRFVAGYLWSDLEEEAGLHAWAEAYDEGLGWIGFDPMWQLCPTENYVRLSVGLDAETAIGLRTVPAFDVVQSASVGEG
jgi:hypothetical protein